MLNLEKKTSPSSGVARPPVARGGGHIFCLRFSKLESCLKHKSQSIGPSVIADRADDRCALVAILCFYCTSQTQSNETCNLNFHVNCFAPSNPIPPRYATAPKRRGTWVACIVQQIWFKLFCFSCFGPHICV